VHSVSCPPPLTWDALEPNKRKQNFLYGDFGAIVTPFFGVQNAYGADTAEYNNALGFFVLMWALLNLFSLFVLADKLGLHWNFLPRGAGACSDCSFVFFDG
jgi:hypothetical protein